MATPVFCCGAECGVTGTGSHWTSISGTASFSTSTVRSGARSIRANPTAGISYFSSTALTGGDKIIARFYVRFTTLPNANASLFGIISGVSAIRILYEVSSGTLICSAGAAAGTGGVSVTTGVWYRIDLKCDISNNPWTADAYVDGVAVGQATNSVAANTFTEIRCGSFALSSTSDIFYDDIIISQTLADYPLGPGKVEHYVPTSDGSHNVAGANDFEIGTGGVDITNATTTAHELVDDVPLQSGAPGTTDFINMIAPPNATDYVECIFGPAPGISPAPRAPRAVEVIAGIAQSGTGLGNMEIRIDDNGTNDAMYSATGVAGVTTIAFKRKHYATGPAGAWVIGGGGNGDFTDLRVRFGSPAALDVNPDQYFTGIMIEAEFEGETDPAILSAQHRNIEQPYFKLPILSKSLRSILAGSFFMDNFPIGPPFPAEETISMYRNIEQPYFKKPLITPSGIRLNTPRIESLNDPSVQLFLSATGITDNTIVNALNNLIFRIRGEGLFNKFHAIWPMVGGTELTHAYNLVNAHRFQISFNGNWAHSSNGALPDGSTAYGDTGLNCATVMTLRNVHFSYYSRTNASGIGDEFGVWNEVPGFHNGFQMVIRFTDDNYYSDIHNLLGGAGDRVFASNSDSRGFHVSSRIAVNDHRIFRNGSQLNISISSSIGQLVNLNLYIGAVNKDNVAVNFGNKQCAFASVGLGLTAAEVTTFNNIVAAFQLALGRNV